MDIHGLNAAFCLCILFGVLLISATQVRWYYRGSFVIMVAAIVLAFLNLRAQGMKEAFDLETAATFLLALGTCVWTKRKTEKRGIYDKSSRDE